LLHDMGKLVMATMFPEAYRSILEEHSATCCPLAELERRVFGIDHPTTGSILCDLWKLPRSLSQLVADHHQRRMPTSEFNAVANANVLDRLVSPHASGEVHVSVDELATLFAEKRILPLLRRLVVSQSMQPAATRPEPSHMSGDNFSNSCLEIRRPLSGENHGDGRKAVQPLRIAGAGDEITGTGNVNHSERSSPTPSHRELFAGEHPSTTDFGLVADIRDRNLAEAVCLIGLACGYTPVSDDDGLQTVIVTDRGATVSRASGLDRFLTRTEDNLWLNIAALHRTLLLTVLTESAAASNHSPGVFPEVQR
ncbi:MAG: HDOD domain-containing protein, partial [Planctomycetaceae bacterium]|nr:HDOD domain-containing protein [Planctomycetaceae bacterium]